MRKHRPNYRLVKIHRSYTVEEIARLLWHPQEHRARLGEGGAADQ